MVRQKAFNLIPASRYFVLHWSSIFCDRSLGSIKKNLQFSCKYHCRFDEWALTINEGPAIINNARNSGDKRSANQSHFPTNWAFATCRELFTALHLSHWL